MLGAQAALAVQNVGEKLSCGQQPNLPGSAPPDLDCDLGVDTARDRLLRGHVTLARDALAESVQDRQRVGVGSAMGAPDNGNVVDVVGKETVQVGVSAELSHA